MHYFDDKVSDVQIAYIGGGSRGWAWSLMTDLAMDDSLSGTVRLYDIDRTSAKNNEIIGNRLSSRQDVVGKWHYAACPSLENALEGCDFVIISILPGTFDEMESDVHLPERLGIYQSVGDTAGPGGILRGLRTVPMFAEIASAIRDHAPKAWVINYTNPMSLCVKTLYHIYPGIKAFGCCHEVFGTQKLLRDICEKTLGLKEIRRQDIHVNVLGINHFTWFDEASCKGIDLFPVYAKYTEEHYAQGHGSPDSNWANNSFSCAHRVKFDLFRRYGLIAAAGDRHLAEFMPGEEYLKDPATVSKWKFGLTTVDWRKKDLQKRLERSRRLAAGEEDISLKPSGEEGLMLLKALCGLGRIVSNVNIPNASLQIPNLPPEAVVETNALFSRDSIKPVAAGKLPENIKSLIMPHVENHERVLQAALSCDRFLVYEAFSKDPLVKGRGSDGDIRSLTDDMISNTLGCLPEGWRK